MPPIAAAAAGVLAAGLVPLGHIGIGWVLAGLAVAVAITVSLGRAPRSPGGAAGSLGGAAGDQAPGYAGHSAMQDLSPANQVERWGWALAALVLLAVGALRAAEWLLGLCLFGAAVATVLAITGGRSLRGLALGALLVPAAGWRGVIWGHRGIARLRHHVSPAVRIGPTVAVTAAVLLVFGALFASADAVFSRLLGTAVPDLQGASVLRWTFLFGAAGTLVLGAVFLLLAPPTLDRVSNGRPRIRLIEWAVPVGALVALFASFVGVQLTVLFGGVTYVLGPDGPTYAQYARGGFWQLLLVTALTLLVIGLVARLAPRHTPVERWCLRGLLGALGALTLVIVASALFRMHTYQEAYGFTRLRVLVSVAELWLGLVFLLVLAAGVRLRARWLPRAVVATGIAALLALAALNPDRFIAERNIDRWESGRPLDTAYLAGLSADAVPALVCLPGPQREAALTGNHSRPSTDWRRANLAQAIARDLLADAPPGCDGRYRQGSE
jgi:hypothetical protein